MLAAEAQGAHATDAIRHMKGALADEAGQAIAFRDATIWELRQQLETLAADAKKREEVILQQGITS